MNPTRREFIGTALALTPVMGLTLPNPPDAEMQEEKVTDEGAVVCRWIDQPGVGSWLVVGRDVTLDRHGLRGALVKAVLYRSARPDAWEFRLGFGNTTFRGAEADVRKLAEYKLVEWLKELSRAADRLAFRLK